ncbi:MAG TPA: class I SAM-dependent methyltransferase [Chloroflexia bacterium]|nr:class I SAM-dependent methyltransferase [Chloroflexia bacterium]
MADHPNLLAESRAIWDTNAEAWDARMDGGPSWQTTLIAPTVERLLDLQPGARVLDIACGNGIFARRLAELGADVVAADFSPRLIDLARQRTTLHTERIAYHVADATDEAALRGLAGPSGQPFDAAVCNNAIMDMPAIDPLFRAVAGLLRPGGRFVFSVMHPCFNGLAMAMQAELPDYAAAPTYAIRVSRYLTTEVTQGLAINTQPREQYYWHRPLHELCNSAFAAGLCMDRLEEPRVPAPDGAIGPFHWAHYDIPPLLFVRLRAAG